jgi:hypothetical protein
MDKRYKVYQLNSDTPNLVASFDTEDMGRAYVSAEPFDSVLVDGVAIATGRGPRVAVSASEDDLDWLEGYQAGYNEGYAAAEEVTA